MTVPLGKLDTSEVHARLLAEGTAWLTTTDLMQEDLASVWWSGSSSHVEGLTAVVERARRSEVDYIAVRADDHPVAIGGVNYDDPEHSGELWQLSTHPELQRLGIGGVLIAGLEARILRRGLANAWIGVDKTNGRAFDLYLRRGYEKVGEGVDSWQEANQDGQPITVRVEIWWMRRQLG